MHLQTSLHHVLSEHQRALRSRSEWGVELLPDPHTHSLTIHVSNLAHCLTLFFEPVPAKTPPVPKIQALNSAQDLTSKTGLSPTPRPDPKDSRLLIFWITHLDDCYLRELSSLSQTKLSQVACSPSACQSASRQKLWNREMRDDLSASEITVFVVEITKVKYWQIDECFDQFLYWLCT